MRTATIPRVICILSLIILLGGCSSLSTKHTPWYLNINDSESREGVAGGVPHTVHIVGDTYTVIPDYTTGGIQAIVKH